MVGGEHRRELLFELVGDVVRVGRALVEEDPRDPLEQLPAALERHQGVLEGRRLGIREDRLDLGALLGHAALEGRLEVLVADVGERRQRVRQRARREERIGHLSQP